MIAALPAFALVRDWVLSIEGGPLVSLAIATNLLAALTGLPPAALLLHSTRWANLSPPRRRARN